MSVLKRPIVVIGFMMMLAWIAFLVGKHHSGGATAYVNMKQVIALPLEKVARTLNKQQQREFAALYNRYLPQTLDDYAADHHLNLVTASTLYDYSGVDVTKAIIRANLKKVEARHV
ncbi:hypothetical protein AVI48_15585 (plasmid) [Piscirickettsia salmonis]|nr:hypothetical protein AVI48_15585 [Piscirickettsia salmonis]APS49264.1 hypothetical protein AVI49_16540 [Piscirickettsia salmonis]